MLAVRKRRLLLSCALLSTLALLPIARARAWSSSDLMYAESAMYIVDNAYFSGRCLLVKPHTTFCNPDRLLDRDDAWRIDRAIGDVARGAGAYWLADLKGPRRGRMIALVVLEKVATKPPELFAEEVYRQWVLLKCGEPQWSGCSNSVVIVVATKQRLVRIYAGQTAAAKSMGKDFVAIELSMRNVLRRWEDDSLTRALLGGIDAVGKLTTYIDSEPEDNTSYTFASILLAAFIIAALSAIRGVRDLRDSPS